MNNPNDLDAAKKSALSILAFADNTELKLREKLKKKGFNDETVSAAVEAMKSYGYLNESRYILRAAEMLAEQRCYGKRRIVMELHKKGFSPELISQLDFDEMDFAEYCRNYISKNRLIYNEKTVAALLRRGYGIGEIKKAFILEKRTK